MRKNKKICREKIKNQWKITNPTAPMTKKQRKKAKIQAKMGI
jgi:hypothetical protein